MELLGNCFTTNRGIYSFPIWVVFKNVVFKLKQKGVGFKNDI